MKAIILAGGKGTRLMPLTAEKPKPMVSLNGQPVMSYAINHLQKLGIKEIGVTLQHMPETIIKYFGKGADWKVNLTYFLEESPLGTAGSVKNAESFLDERFIVLSGDGITDFDLKPALDFHTKRKSKVTMVLTDVEDPTQFGIVETDQQGKIIRFIEKPKAHEVFTSQINSGIYIIEPEILKAIPAGTFYDFSKDLFPALMSCGVGIYGFKAHGYWSDIGTINQYYQTEKDILQGRIKIAN